MSDDEFPVLMDFGDAMRAIQDGFSVRRDGWEDAAAVVRLWQGQLRLLKNGTSCPWLISDADVFGRDWTT